MTEKRQKDVELDPMLWQLFKNHFLIEMVEINALLHAGYFCHKRRIGYLRDYNSNTAWATRKRIV